MNVRYVFCSFLALAFLLAPEKSHARWMNANTGRFLTMDSYEGEQSQPLSLHKYLYAHGNPINRIDPSGKSDISLGSLSVSMGIGAGIGALSSVAANIAMGKAVTWTSV